MSQTAATERLLRRPGALSPGAVTGLAAWASRLQSSDLCSQGAGEDFAWLDGCSGGSWLGLKARTRITGRSLQLLDEVDRAWRSDPEQPWIGWISYDCCAADLLGQGGRVASGGPIDFEFRQYPALLREQSNGAILALGTAAGVTELADVYEQILRRARRTAAQISGWPFESPEPDWSPNFYRARVADVQAYLRAGDSYQVNLSQRFHADWQSGILPARGQADASDGLAHAMLAAHLELRSRAPAEMGALIRVANESWIISNSPETLLEVEANDISGLGRGNDLARCRPIKGTTPRLAQDNAKACEALFASVKDRAEHLMIVDLIRNDLGRMAIAGSVRAPVEPSLMQLPTVNHLVSTIECQLRPRWRLLDLFRSVVPGGSITGAPKRRTLEIIAELEGEPRGIYCGVICILHPGGLLASIPIRTGWASRRGLVLRSGGGIVIDSDPEKERLETLAKLRAFAPGHP